MLFRSYVADFCIDKVNSDEISNYHALSLMKNAYLFLRDNVRICKNVISLIRFNLNDYLNDDCKNVNGMFDIIDTIKKNKSITFTDNTQELKSELNNGFCSQKKFGQTMIALIRPLSE